MPLPAAPKLRLLFTPWLCALVLPGLLWVSETWVWVVLSLALRQLDGTWLTEEGVRESLPRALPERAALPGVKVWAILSWLT